jgi:ferredoxin--NADP+ reductase
LSPDSKYLVAVVGAGPAGLYGAKELADQGARVALFNRDVKPGGLAEYGIYHSKHKMKNGLRKQFSKIMAHPDIEYFGNLTVGAEGDLSLDDLRDLGFQVIMVTAGAQGTKWLGLDGEELEGVYHAKDVVYHYNHLPPFATKEMKIGRKSAIIGIGNVMCDIARWMIRDLKIDSVVCFARRGPAEAKWTRKEFASFAANMDMDAFEAEFAKCTPIMEGVNQDVEAAKAFIMEGVASAKDPVSETRFEFDFCASPKGMTGEDGKLKAITIEETTLVPKNGDTKAQGTGNITEVEIDSVVFCIGDKVDESFGLPTEWSEFSKNPEPRFPIDDMSYEAYDHEAEKVIEDIFLAGWSRKASDGLVGAARKDGTNGSKAVLQYLEQLGPAASLDTQGLHDRIAALDKYVVRNEDYDKLLAAEKAVAESKGADEFKFDTNEEMLEAIGADK